MKKLTQKKGYKEYIFPAGIIKVFNHGKCFWYPRWTCISFEVNRKSVLEALKQLNYRLAQFEVINETN